ncbi:MAG: eL32 family ribosomal protein [Nanoarchaeota archaeon]|nr:eL32 family ribosomal protein [Nanoarchaeota archaeon]
MSKKFPRQESTRHIKLGSRKSKITWRRPTGRHSKMRRKRRNYPASPHIGRRTPNKESGLISGLTPILIYNMKDLSKCDKTTAAVISARIGAKKRIEIIKQAKEKQIKFLNVKEI